jgi:uncharacterized membrane protein (UPF0127 family)
MKIKINNNLFDVKTVLTSKDTQKGMMGKKFDGSFNGMLFFMENEPHSFWMKNCLVHLDIIFIDGNVITKIHHNCKPCFSDDCEHFTGNGDMILELPGGECKKYKIEEGDFVELI